MFILLQRFLEKVSMTENCSFSLFTNRNFSLLASELITADMSFVDENTLTVNVARLRRKLESCGLEGFILTKKGQGYMVEA